MACRSDDAKLRSAIVNLEPNIRFISPEKMEEALYRWIDRACKPGFEGEYRPEIVRFAWDGDTLRTEREVNITQARELREAWGNDWNLIDALRSGGEEIRAELEKAVGIEDGERFKFETALYPSLGLRDDALFLTSGCGMNMGDFITVVNSQVALYRQYNPEEVLSQPKKLFESVNDALDSVRKAVLGEKNLQAAKQDYNKYTESLKMDAGQSKGPKL